jgi:hypothetical protein
VGAITGYIFWRQLSVMQGQLDEMQTASTLTKAQLRANIRVLQFTQARNVQLQGWEIAVIWHNSGNTNADEFGQWNSVRRFEPDVPADFDLSRPYDASASITRLTAGANTPIQGFPVFISNEDIQRAVSGIGVVYMWGHADYRDVFPKSDIHHTHYCTAILIGDLNSATPFTFAAYNRPNCNYAN